MNVKIFLKMENKVKFAVFIFHSHLSKESFKFMCMGICSHVCAPACVCTTCITSAQDIREGLKSPGTRVSDD